MTRAKRIRLKEKQQAGIRNPLTGGSDGFHFDFYVLSAAPVEVIQSALEGIVPQTTSSARSSNTRLRARSKAWYARRPAMEKSRVSNN